MKNMLSEFYIIIKENLLLISTIITSIITWFIVKKPLHNKILKKESLNVEADEYEILSKRFKIYQSLIDDIEKRFQEKVAELQNENFELKLIINDLKQLIKDLEKENNNLLKNKK